MYIVYKLFREIRIVRKKTQEYKAIYRKSRKEFKILYIMRRTCDKDCEL